MTIPPSDVNGIPDATPDDLRLDITREYREWNECSGSHSVNSLMLYRHAMSLFRLLASERKARLAAEAECDAAIMDQANYLGKCGLCSVANCDMLTDTYCAACKVAELEAALTTLRTEAADVLRPFAEYGRPCKISGTPNFHDLEDDVCVATNSGLAITAGDCRRAAAFLARLAEPKKKE